MTNKNYQSTIYACFAGYIIQAVVNNFVPLLFLTFRSEFNIPLSQITLLITFNFGIQLVVDLVSAAFVDKIGYRRSMIGAHICAACGLIALTILPNIMSSPFVGLLISVVLYAVGGGLLEVLVSPIVEACPTENKETAMSLLHSFYCWGQVGVVLLSTAFFYFFGISHWRILALLWSILPLANMAAFFKVPIAPLQPEGEKGLGFKELMSNGMFWVLMVMMFSAGASEQSVSQWASALAESGMGVSKTVGDLLGPMLFAVMMGTSRTIFAKHGPGAMMRTGEKAQDFSQAMKDLASYCRKYAILIFGAVILAAAGTALNVIGPSKLADITDLITAGLRTSIDVDAVVKICVTLAVMSAVCSASRASLQKYIRCRMVFL